MAHKVIGMRGRIQDSFARLELKIEAWERGLTGI